MVKILYVDDEPINLELFELTFNDKYEVLLAASGRKALHILDKNPDIKIVISDMKMPEMNGLEFIKAASSKHSSIYYYILSGFDITQEMVNAVKDKILRKYFIKPFDKNELEKELESVFK